MLSLGAELNEVADLMSARLSQYDCGSMFFAPEFRERTTSPIVWSTTARQQGRRMARMSLQHEIPRDSLLFYQLHADAHDRVSLMVNIMADNDEITHLVDTMNQWIQENAHYLQPAVLVVRVPFATRPFPARCHATPIDDLTRALSAVNP